MLAWRFCSLKLLPPIFVTHTRRCPPPPPISPGTLDFQSCATVNAAIVKTFGTLSGFTNCGSGEVCPVAFCFLSVLLRRQPDMRATGTKTRCTILPFCACVCVCVRLYQCEFLARPLVAAAGVRLHPEVLHAQPGHWHAHDPCEALRGRPDVQPVRLR